MCSEVNAVKKSGVCVRERCVCVCVVFIWVVCGVDVMLLLLLLGIFFTEGISPDQSSYRKLVHVSLQWCQSQQICHVQTFCCVYRIMISFNICFRILCFKWLGSQCRSQCCDEVCWLSFGCERRIRREIFRVVFSLSQSNRLFSLICFQVALAVSYSSVEFVEDLIIVEDHWADSTLSWLDSSRRSLSWLGIFFTEGISPDQSSYRKLDHVSLQCWQSQQICHVQTLSFHICFRILCFQAALVVLYLSVEFVEDLIVVEDHWADSTLALVHFHLFRVTQSSSASRLLCIWSADVRMWSILGHPQT